MDYLGLGKRESLIAMAFPVITGVRKRIRTCTEENGHVW